MGTEHSATQLAQVLQGQDVEAMGNLLQDILSTAVRDAQPPARSRPASRPADAPYFDAETKNMRRALKRALREDPSSNAAKVLQRRYTNHIRRRKRIWNQARLDKLKDDLKRCPRRFWKTAKAKRAVRIVEDVDKWQKYIKSLFAKPMSPSRGRPGGAERPGIPASNKLCSPFTPGEIEQVLKSLKAGKAADVFGVRVEVVKDLLLLLEPGGKRTYLLLPHLTHAFNLIMDAGQLPSTWCKGCVHPIAKIVSPTCCDDYRCITVGSLLGKLFAATLDKRLADYLEQHELRSPFQAGFRRGHSTMDQAFVLNHIIEAAKHQGSQVYCAFVDFRKAFDTVRHEHLWDRLRTYGVDGNFLRCVQSMYEQSQACVAVNGQLTGYEPLEIGVRQGDPLSPTLFGLYIETLADDLSAGMTPSNTFAVGGVPVYLLLYADDLVLVAATPQALQQELNILNQFCTDWDLTVNLKKTKSLVFNPKPPDKKLRWKLGDLTVAVTTQYTYLGLVFDAQKGLQAASGPLVDSGRKAMFGLMGICSQQSINDPSLKHHMFNALVLPVLSYGAELWGGFSPLFTKDEYYKRNKAPAEKVYTMFLRWFTGANRSTHNRILAQAGGKLPMGAHWDSRAASFWNRLSSMQENRLAHLAFKDNLTLFYNGADCWASRAVEHFTGLGMLGEASIYHPQTPLWQCRMSAEEAIADSNDAWWANYQTSPRALPTERGSVPGRTLYTFGAWFLQISQALQVHHNVPARHWRRVIRFCAGSHALMNAQARWSVGVVSRCPCCGAAVEDELHLALECPAYQDIRQQHGALFAGVRGTGSAAMQSLFQQQNFPELSAFLRACDKQRDSLIIA
jgi:hypothetical protein